ALGLFERPLVEVSRAAACFETPAQRELARRAASESLVLLRNDGVLPLRPGLRRIAVLGPGADDKRVLQGDYHYPAHQRVADEVAGEALPAGAAPGGAAPGGAADLSLLPETAGQWQPGPFYTRHVTPLEGIRACAGAETEVVSVAGCAVTGSDESGIAEAAALAAGADVAVVVVAGRSGLGTAATVGEARDATDLGLTGAQLALLRAVAATGTPVVGVVLSGRAHDLSEVDALCGALLQAWPLGEEGGTALAEVLFGAVNPSGRLPVSLPRRVGQVPRYLGHRAGGSTAMFYGAYSDSPTAPLYPFGHGLSYTSFEYGELRVAARDTASPVEAEIEVANSGAVAGAEVVQLYLSDLVASVVRPEAQLAAFARVVLEPGERKLVRFEIHPSRLAFFDKALRRVAEPGAFRFAAGASSTDLRAVVEVEIGGSVVEHPITTLRPAVVSVEEVATTGH
ncbi:MAG TPA: glycoside hydrolase family 3 C-terminal domain-containing protein, partial [Acidimicrobiales bacterium]|nr:glycoside hydrolase family 3 C-terminal domain-containing protein [Acidimicrobiales bacterium]